MLVVRVLIYAIWQPVAAAMPSSRRNTDRRAPIPGTPAILSTPDSPGNDFDDTRNSLRTYTLPTVVTSESADRRSVPLTHQDGGRQSDGYAAREYQSIPTAQSSSSWSPHAIALSHCAVGLFSGDRPACTSPLDVESARDVSDFRSSNKNIVSPTPAQQAHMQVKKAVNDVVKIAKELDDYFVERDSYQRRYQRWGPMRGSDFLSAIETVNTHNKLRDEKIRVQPGMPFNAMAADIIKMYPPIHQLLGQLEAFRDRSRISAGEFQPDFSVEFQPATFYRHQIWLRKVKFTSGTQICVPDAVIRQIFDYAGDRGLLERTYQTLDRALGFINRDS